MHPHDDHHNEKKSSFHFSVFNTPRLTNPLPTTSPPEKPTSEKDKDKEPVKPATKNHRFSWSSTKSTKSSEPYRLSNLPQLITPVLTQQNLEKESGKEAFSSKRLSFPFSFFDPSASHDSRKTRGSLTIPNTPTTRTPTTPTPTPTTPTTPNLQQEPEKKHQELLHIELLIYKCHHSETIVKPMRDYTTYTMVPYMCTPCVEWLKRYGSKGKKDGASSRRKSIAF
ncbi:hypothetical protein BZA77DRAFT_356251 [Pyronema omphalodes]|nr:hypothetical protein BZA77DRAFT_356251 [Pyronema omphalodes]